jgi:hypothetical protein
VQRSRDGDCRLTGGNPGREEDCDRLGEIDPVAVDLDEMIADRALVTVFLDHAVERTGRLRGGRRLAVCVPDRQRS